MGYKQWFGSLKGIGGPVIGLRVHELGKHPIQTELRKEAGCHANRYIATASDCSNRGNLDSPWIPKTMTSYIVAIFSLYSAISGRYWEIRRSGWSADWHLNLLLLKVISFRGVREIEGISLAVGDWTYLRQKKKREERRNLIWQSMKINKVISSWEF